MCSGTGSSASRKYMINKGSGKSEQTWKERNPLFNSYREQYNALKANDNSRVGTEIGQKRYAASEALSKLNRSMEDVTAAYEPMEKSAFRQRNRARQTKAATKAEKNVQKALSEYKDALRKAKEK